MPTWTDNNDYWTITTTDATTTITLVKDNPDWGYITTGYIAPISKHFNCKHCGAPNQIDICEYCGCAAETEG